ncbi:MAG: PorP/SprF family type IX secretion system membrane protein [Bacteroidetes bacterium]|nr:PorP/SprF family type IX secretion system membrane protein [Bacteroidota bacterium]
MKRLFISLLIVSCLAASAQDLHLSQFYTSPLNINPATAGSFVGDYRLMTNYKSQWAGISKGYRTVMASYDMKVFSPKSKRWNYLAAGLSFMGDKAGMSRMGSMQTDLDIAYNLGITRHQSLCVGVRTGFAQRSISVAGLKWDNQFDGNTYDSNLSTGQNTIGETTQYLDLGAGLDYKYDNYTSKFHFNLGASAFHLHEPKISFLGNSQRLYRKYIGHAMIQVPIMKSHYYIVPQFIYSMQGPYQEIVAGAYFRYVFGMDNEGAILNTYTLISSYVQIGALYRTGDALVIIASVEMRKALSFGISYDLNVSKLKAASRMRGGLEVSLSYKGAFKNK